ncbi:YgjV family protein [Pseudidiomarina sp.]|uniref:YgjV family protein n=1 Tax=Pseudidiomarina sp. TaxID=2081707 RepID=UPI003A97D86B
MISVAETFGLLALIANFIAYRQTTANRYRIVSACALGALSVHFFMLGAVAGGVVTAMAVVRNMIALRWRGPIVLWGFVAINFIFFGWELSNHEPLIPLLLAYISSIIFTVGSIVLNDPTRIRRWFLLAELLGLAYAIVVGSVSGTVFNIVNLTSIILKLLQDRRSERLSERN